MAASVGATAIGRDLQAPGTAGTAAAGAGARVALLHAARAKSTRQMV